MNPEPPAQGQPEILSGVRPGDCGSSRMNRCVLYRFPFPGTPKGSVAAIRSASARDPAETGPRGDPYSFFRIRPAGFGCPENGNARQPFRAPGQCRGKNDFWLSYRALHTLRVWKSLFFPKNSAGLRREQRPEIIFGPSVPLTLTGSDAQNNSRGTRRHFPENPVFQDPPHGNHTAGRG